MPTQPEAIDTRTYVVEPSDSFGNATTPRKDQCNAETIIENIEEFLKGNASVQSVSCQTNVKAVRLVETQTGRYGGGHYSIDL